MGDMANEDDFDSLEATDKVKVLIKRISEDVVFPTSFGLSLDLPEHNIVAGTTWGEDYESIKDDSNIIVEIDREVGVLEKNHVTNLRRKLAENTPYGIRMVMEEMNFWSKLGNPSGAIKVCVADTGYDLGHEDTPKGDDVTGTDNPEYSSESWNKDPHGHGTHCSGTVSALGGNDKGVVGVIPNNAGERFQLVIANSLTGSGSGSWSGVVAGVDTCVSNGAKVVSLSLGGYYYSKIAEDFYKKKYEEQGILFVAAAGNGGNTNKLYPASYPSLMSVAAIDSNKNKASFSTFNDQVEISAPGVSIESSLPGNNYAKWSGTSMATPHVAGVAGLLWMYFPDCENYQIRNAILATAEDLRADGCDIYTGFGVVRAKSAYELLAKGNCGGDLGVTDGETGGCDQLSPGPAPTSAPVPSAPSTSYPTHTAPTMYPTHTAPTPYPTEAAPTSRPTGKICADVLETCKKHADCCTKRCNRIKGECRAARKLTKAPTKKMTKAPTKAPDTKPEWTKLYGRGSLAGDTTPELWEKIDKGSYIKRICNSCSTSTHKSIIYKRLTAPGQIDFGKLFLSDWFSKPSSDAKNAIKKDFNLYSTFDDAKNDVSPWSYCNYNDGGIGFPRDCGPTAYVPSEWNSMTRGGETDFAYYLYTGK